MRASGEEEDGQGAGRERGRGAEAREEREMKKLLPAALAAILLLAFLAAPAVALEPETLAAITGAVAIGSVISQGELDPQLATTIVRSLRRDGAGNAEIAELFRALLNEPRARRTAGAGRGMGAFVQQAHADGLRGRALAEAIHREQARRGVPGQVRKEETSMVPPGRSRAREHPARGARP